jgi:hypothetical protein
MRRSFLFLSLLLFSGLSSTPGAFAADAFFDGISADGKVAVFTTEQSMVGGDTDQELDVYVRAQDPILGEDVSRPVSIGPGGGNDTLPATYRGMSTDGKYAFFSTKERLVTADKDEEQDVYMRDLLHNETLLVSQGSLGCAPQGCGNGNLPASLAPDGVAADGLTIFFTSQEQLSTLDTDTSLDIYAARIAVGSSAAVQDVVLASGPAASCVVGPCGNGLEGASYRGSDELGVKVVFSTAESLSVQDGDTEVDLYARDIEAETTTLVTVPGNCPAAPCVPVFRGIAADGSHVFFESSERLVGDTDSVQDVYDWAGGGVPALVSIGLAGGNGPDVARYAGATADGAAVYFETDEKLTDVDGDVKQDVYVRLAGVTELVSAGEEARGNGPFPASFEWVSAEGGTERVVLITEEQLTVEDTDAVQDVYERAGGVTTLISAGGAGTPSPASFVGASTDGARIFFVSSQSFLAEDTDLSQDVYRYSASGTERVSSGQINGNKELPATLHAVSADGSRAFFKSQERLTEGDVDSDFDIYRWSETSGTVLVSARNGLTLEPPPPILQATLPASPGPSLNPTIVGQANPGTSIKVYKGAGCIGQVVAQGTAGELASPGLTVTVAVVPGSTTNYSATAEAGGLPSDCSNVISYKQEETAPPPPPGEEDGGEAGGGTDTDSGGAGSGAGSGPSSGTTAGGKTGSGGSAGGGAKGGFVYVTPVPRITFGPAAKTRLRRPTFRFLDSTEQPGTRFFCRVDRQRWAGCSSPMQVRKLKLGRHLFSVKAVNAVGTASASPVKRSFRVVR